MTPQTVLGGLSPLTGTTNMSVRPMQVKHRHTFIVKGQGPGLEVKGNVAHK